MQPFDFQLRTRVVFGAGALARLGALARESNFRRTLLVADRGLIASGHVAEASGVLAAAGIEVVLFHEFDVNPDTRMCAHGREFAAPLDVDSIIGLGGGSSLDCAKGINFLLTNGGEMRDYHGYGKATRPLLPMIAVPTTAGTGSEAQTYALISDADTHIKMACGDPRAAFRIAVLDPALTVSQPAAVTAAAGFDAIAHAVESYVTTRRNAVSDMFAREAWALLEANYERVLAAPQDLEARGAMQLGAYYAGAAIEHSMLGATHACANPLTQHYGTTHGEAVALMLPHVVRWNARVVASRYAELARVAGRVVADENAGDVLAARLDELKAAGALDKDESATGIRPDDLEMLAADAARQWTGTFNPRPFDAGGALELYRRALQLQLQNV
ncbi:MAG TPA: iron-containing alcohol dehydrogenase [Pyrinomonadaceae bacterium]|jgi:alcohol dehydrogenase|nr:iron-containing alcohol dehydrogenase [Pyrinomonadaceae bacterium]